jgi:hypothetical protein
METEELISEYRKAYELANAKAAPVVIYKHGWFRIGHPSYPYRRKDMIRALGVLQERAAQKDALVMNGKNQ